MKNSLADGLRASIPIAAGYVPVAITFGLLARGTGLSYLDSQAASLIVFAGAAQFMGVGMFSRGINAIQIIFATFLLNLRHLLMSSAIVHRLVPLKKGMPRRWLLAFGVTDEVFAVASGDERIEPRYLLGLELGAYLAWNGGTLFGALVGSVLPETLQTAMGFALYALFAALLMSHLERDRTLLIPAAVAAVVNTVLRSVLGVHAGAAFPVAMIAGAAAGFLLPERTEPVESTGPTGSAS